MLTYLLNNMTNEDKQNHHIKTIHELLDNHAVEFVAPDALKAPGPANLETVDNIPTAIAPEFEPPIVEKPEEEIVSPAEEKAERKTFVRDIGRYAIMFAVALIFFYVILNFRAVMTQVANIFSPPEENQKVALGAEEKSFNEWIGKYYVHVNDAAILAANEDADGDGLTNLDEFYLKTNPLKADTDGDGFDDGSEVLSGTNPLYAGVLTGEQEEIINENLDRTLIGSRKDFQGVAGESNTAREFYPIDVNKPGNLTIPRLNINLPIIWSQEFAKMEEDLKSGVAHHPGTPYPGERGTSSIHGHSSGNFDDGGYKTAFTKINFLEPGDDVFVVVYGRDGTSRRYRHVVRSKKVYAKTDPKQFEDLGGYFLNLSTSWPIGTSRERYVVTTELVGL